ncbi:MAG: Lrp/AsnC family transcriptional regulator [Candidatus Thermoplasmatota archaeon]|nr:Lrp/AsnC family transcriptional regulator [Candidatus Thermoplasmatota archaeon]MCL5793648.1 Lrp/AsnC family transcriptional regulator [Candidatus Thermoplasmatota archaeon]
MDQTDSEILRILRLNSRSSNSKIARELNISEATVRKRVARLLSSGIIRKFTIETSESLVSSIVMVKTETRKTKSVLNALRSRYSEVYELSGGLDMAISIKRKGIEEINREVDIIRNLDGVTATDTLIRLS